MSAATRKPCALLRLMADKQGQKITARDCAALLLAARMLEELDAKIGRNMQIYSDTLMGEVIAKARADALEDGMRALLEVHA